MPTGLPFRTPRIIQRKIVSSMPSLRILDCSESSWFNDRLLLHLAHSCPHLQHLSARRCENICGLHLSKLLQNCRHLKSLNLQRTGYVDLSRRVFSRPILSCPHHISLSVIIPVTCGYSCSFCFSFIDNPALVFLRTL